MKYFEPELTPDDDLPAQSSLQDQFGGLPWGLPPERWPLCASCGGPQSLLAQLRHHRERLDLGNEGRVLFVFACNDDSSRCPTRDRNSGASCCLVAEQGELAQGCTLPPLAQAFPQRRLDRWLGEQVHPAWRVVRWYEREDGIPESYPGSFGLNPDVPDGYDEKEYEGYWSEVSQQTRLGGVPFWIQRPEPPPESRFVGQIDSNCCQAFGDNGIGYIFLSGPASAPRGWFLWQCT
ncbi:MAG: hypothetical protein L0Y71_25150 [Gemmataceae bacterium]|nr:hypothetical protein [Gemmataceae bacterium]